MRVSRHEHKQRGWTKGKARLKHLGPCELCGQRDGTLKVRLHLEKRQGTKEESKPVPVTRFILCDECMRPESPRMPASVEAAKKILCLSITETLGKLTSAKERGAARAA